MASEGRAPALGMKAIRPYLWVLVPLISIGGMFYPLIGLLMAPMLVGLLLMSCFKGRYWCANCCPRGSFLDYVLRPFSRFGKGPAFLNSMAFRFAFLALFMGLFLFRMGTAITSFSGMLMLEKAGFVFASVCLVTSLIASIMGLLYSPRVWCTFCPMGTLQGEIFKRTSRSRPLD